MNVARVVFLLTPQVYLLDVAGPADVFLAAQDLGMPYELAYFADQLDVSSAEGVHMRASATPPTLTADDLVIVPGGRTPVPGPQGLDLLRAHHRAGGMVASVCAGTAALGAAGLLTGRRCTTHHFLQDQLAAEYPKATVVRDVLFVVDGQVASSAGMSSGIDLALHLVATSHGPAAASRVARALVVYSRRNGQQQQVSTLLRYRNHVSELVHRVQDLVELRYTKPLTLTDLAREVGCSERTLTRHFRAATGLTPLRYQQMLRLENAEHLLADGATLDAAARAVGLSDARALRALRSATKQA